MQSEKYHMTLNAKKTQVTVVSEKNENDSREITVDEEKLKLVQSFKDLGTMICCDKKDDRKMKQSFAAAK